MDTPMTPSPTPDDTAQRLDAATGHRLARLRTMPVDTSRLERRLLAEIPRPTGPRRSRLIWLRPVRAVAALALVAGLIGAILWGTSGGPALASPSQMAQMHYDLVSGRTPAMQVSSIEAANRMLGGGSPEIPDVPAEHVMTCCMKSIKDKKVACVLLKDEGAAITMTVANAVDMKLPDSPTVRREGVTYHVQSSGNVQMVMTEHHGRWICLIAELPAERLMALAAKLRF